MKFTTIIALLFAANVAQAADMPRRPTEPFRESHFELQTHLEHVRVWIGNLNTAPDSRAVMDRIVKFFQEHLEPHAEWEEKVLFPAVDKQTGSPPNYPFTSTMRYEHTTIDRWIKELATESAKAKPDVVAFQRRADNLLGLFIAHFEEEEKVLLPILDKTMTPAEFDKEIGPGAH